MKVAFSQFWPGFRGDASFFYRLLEAEGLNPQDVSGRKDKPDLEFVSVFPSRRDLLLRKLNTVLSRSPSGGSEQALANTIDTLPKRLAPTRVWFTGENIRVPHGQDFDYSLSYEQDPYTSSNTYFPLWYTHLDWFGKPEFNHRVGKDVRADELMRPRSLSESKPKFACAFIGNPHPMRSRAIEALSMFGEVDVFGKAVGKPVKYKADIAKNYKYMICFENDLFPGYVTEKLLDAYLAETVPIYWGLLGGDKDINSKSFINLADFSSIAETIDQLHSVNKNQYEEIYSEPFLVKKPSIQNLIEVIRSAK